VKTYVVYILRCTDNSYYTGITSDLDRRIHEHQSGSSPGSYTSARRPVELVFTQEFSSVNQAIEFEKQVKGWSRKKKEALIGGHWEHLKPLAECKNDTSHKNRIRPQPEEGGDG
jgi:putative endonuclease